MFNRRVKEGIGHISYIINRPIYAPTMQCYYLNALLATNQTQTAYKADTRIMVNLEFTALYSCHHVFSRWTVRRADA